MVSSIGLGKFNPLTSPFDDGDAGAGDLGCFLSAGAAEEKRIADAVVLLQSSSASLYDTLSFDCEVPRLDALRGCGQLYTAPEGRFDVITELAAKLFDVPVSVVSLVDIDKGWFKSNYGPLGGCVTRHGSFCSYITVPDFAEVIIVEDCTRDARFAHNPFVMGPPGLRFYSGCPLVTSSGHRIGTLCLCDFKPRHFPSTAYNLQCNLAEIVVREVEREVVQTQLLSEIGEEAEGSGGRSHVLPAAYEPVVILDVSQPSWPVVYANEAWAEVMAPGTAPAELLNSSLWDCCRAADPTLDLASLRAGVEGGNREEVMMHLASDRCGSDCSAEPPHQHGIVRMEFWLASRESFRNAVPVGIPQFVALDEGSAAAEAMACPLNLLWIGTVKTVGGDGAAACHFSPRWSLDGGKALCKLQGDGGIAGLKMGPLIGQGSYGKVYRGTLRSQPVSIKVLDLPAGGSAGATAPAQAVLEAFLSRRFAHPHIVPTLNYKIVSSEFYGLQQVWIIQHLCDKGSLYDFIERGLLHEEPFITSPPSLPNILATAVDIASALCYLHDMDILHGDLSGSNVLLSSAENERGFVALVCDFGLSRALPEETKTKTIGTVTHMPPEMLRDGLLTKAGDAYGFGVLLYEMWSGKRAWAGAAIGNIVYQVVLGGKLLEMPQDCPVALRELAGECMAADHTQRPTFSVIVEKLQRMQEDYAAAST